jgi:hypothetical protein
MIAPFPAARIILSAGSTVQPVRSAAWAEARPDQACDVRFSSAQGCAGARAKTTEAAAEDQKRINRSAALELITCRINVDAIRAIDTVMWTLIDQLHAHYRRLPVNQKKRQVAAAFPYGSMGVLEDLAGAAVFLASGDADDVVSQTLKVDGGNRLNRSRARGQV